MVVARRKIVQRGFVHYFVKRTSTLEYKLQDEDALSGMQASMGLGMGMNMGIDLDCVQSMQQ